MAFRGSYILIGTISEFGVEHGRNGGFYPYAIISDGDRDYRINLGDRSEDIQRQFSEGEEIILSGPVYGSGRFVSLWWGSAESVRRPRAAAQRPQPRQAQRPQRPQPVRARQQVKEPWLEDDEEWWDE